MQRPILAVALATALVLAIRLGADGATVSDERLVPTTVTTVGLLRVQTYGAGTPAMVFIPGLACGSWVWDGAVRRYAAKHAVAVVTLAGFDGVPTSQTPTLDAVDRSLVQLLDTPQFEKPLLVGHSLGGFLALRFGIEHPSLVRGIVAVDGLPVYPSLAQATPERRKAFADATATQLEKATPGERAAAQQAIMATMVSDPDVAARLATLTAKADPQALGAYADAFFAADLRPQLPALTAPVLEVVPVPTKPAPFEGSQAETAGMGDRAEGYRAYYASLLAGAPHVRVVAVPHSLHFVMMDQPAALFDAIDGFVAKL